MPTAGNARNCMMDPGTPGSAVTGTNRANAELDPFLNELLKFRRKYPGHLEKSV